jgi:cysteinyl-tRNA synthetase
VAGERLVRDFSAALDDDLNAPRGVAALFDFVTEGNRLLDAGERPGPGALAAWRLADGVLDAATASQVREVRASPEVSGLPPETVPADPAEVEAWATAWAGARAAAKGRRDFATADRIRKLLLDNGFEVRDRKDGAAEVVRR